MRAGSSMPSTPPNPTSSTDRNEVNAVSSDGLPKLRSGKVRDVDKVGADRLLMVASDRISAFDVILPQPIPDKGLVLTAVSTCWLDQTKDKLHDHLLSV